MIIERKKVLQKGEWSATGKVTIDSTKFYDADGTLNAPPSKYVDVTVTTGQLLALNATPKSIIPAPGAGLYNHFHSAIVYLPYNSAAYAGIAAGEDLAFCYTNISGAQVAVVETTGFLDATASALRAVNALAASGGFTPVANAAIVLGLLSGEITTGNSPLIVRAFYSIRPATLS